MTTPEDPTSGLRDVLAAIKDDPDTVGRIIGAEVGVGAWAFVQQYFDGTARP